MSFTSGATIRAAAMSAAAVLVTLSLVGCPGGTGPLLTVTPTAFTLDAAKDTDSMVLANAGAGTIAWSITGVPDWLVVSPASGTLATGSQVVRVRLADPQTAQPGQRATFDITSNGGTRTIDVTVRPAIEDPDDPDAPDDPGDVGTGLLTASPGFLAFTPDETAGVVVLSNEGDAAVNWSATLPADASWVVNAAPPSGTLEADATQNVAVTVDPAGLAPGTYSADLTFSDGTDSFAVQLQLSIAEPAGALEVDEDRLFLWYDETTNAFTVRNTGDGDLVWRVGATTYEGTATGWLATGAGATEQTLAPGATTSVPVTVTRPADLADGDYSAVVEVQQLEDGVETASDTVEVVMDVDEPDLLLSPTSLDFGDAGTTRVVAVANSGPGAIDWEITNANAFPGWLTANPTGGVVSSTPKTGAQSPQTVVVTVDRSGLPAQEEPFEAVIAFSGTDDDGTIHTAEVAVTMRLPLVYQPAVEDATGVLTRPGAIAEIAMAGAELETTFSVWNLQGATGQLVWALEDAEPRPDWFSFSDDSATSGELAPSNSANITVAADSEGLEPRTYRHTLVLTTNGGDIAVEVSFTVPERPVVTLQPSDGLVLGSTEKIGDFEVANSGPFGTTLEFVVTSDSDEWLFYSPARSTSVGVPPLSILDWQPIAVAMDRFALRGKSGLATVTVQAAAEEDREVIESRELEVSVEVDPYIVEAPPGRLRTPSQVRSAFVLRNVFDEAVAKPQAVLDPFSNYDPLVDPEPAYGVEIFENDLPIDYNETGQRIVEGQFLRVNVLVLLDFSSSMVTAANALPDEAVSPATAAQTGFERLRSFYIDALETLLTRDADTPGDRDTFLDTYRVGLAEFHDRTQPVRMLHDFTRNWELLPATLANANIGEPGATPLVSAITDAVAEITTQDVGPLTVNDADARVIVLLSDGNLTTSPGTLVTLGLDLQSARTQLYSMSWGRGINHYPLAFLAGSSQGHYYPTRDLNTFAAVRDSIAALEDEIAELQAERTELQNNNASDEEIQAKEAEIADTEVQRNQLQAELENPYFNPGFDAAAPQTADEERKLNTFFVNDNQVDSFLREYRNDFEVQPGRLQMMRRDLGKITGLAYTTLNEEQGTVVRIKTSLPPDNLLDWKSRDAFQLPPPDIDSRVVLTSLFPDQTFDFINVAGDTRIGQIALWTDGILPAVGGDNTTGVFVRADYVPRNVSAFVFDVWVDLPANTATTDVRLIPEAEGGLAGDWTMTTAPLAGQNGYTVTLSSPTPLRYGAFGELVELEVTPVAGVLPAFNASLEVDNTLYIDDNGDGLVDDPPPVDPKGFVYSYELPVGDTSTKGAALPAAVVTSLLDFGATESNSAIVILESGAYGDETVIDWQVQDALVPEPFGVPNAVENGQIDALGDADAIPVQMNRGGAGSGPQSGFLFVEYTCPTVSVKGVAISDLRGTLSD